MFLNVDSNNCKKKIAAVFFNEGPTATKIALARFKYSAYEFGVQFAFFAVKFS